VGIVFPGAVVVTVSIETSTTVTETGGAVLVLAVTVTVLGIAEDNGQGNSPDEVIVTVIVPPV
jgi:hypothetical protein